MALAGGIVAAVAVLAVLILATYVVYIQCRKAFANVKWTLEIIYIGLVLAASIGVKLAVFCVMDNLCTFLDGFNACIRAIYAGIGGLTFEGLESFADVNLVMQLQCAYFASSAYAGIMTLIIISAKANYEVYSWLCMHMPFFKFRKNIHVITALTEETLYLARDIKQNDHRAIVAFAGPTLEAFDRHNELCREAMALGVLYWSYSPSKKRAKSILRSLFWFLPRSNFDRFDRKYCVYAFEAKDHIPQEENNLELIVNDVRSRSRHADKLRINYYLLTQREINYQAYQQINDELRQEYIDHTAKQFATFCADKPKEEKQDRLCKEYYAGHVVLTIWCEALTIGRQTIRRLMTVPVGNDRRTVADMLAAGNDGIRVWTIGFAATGQAITGELYAQTAGVDEQNKPRDFFVDIFDPDADELGGIYRATRPMAYYLNDDVIAGDDKWQSIQSEYDKLATGLSQVDARTKESCRQYLQGTALPLHCRAENVLPIFRFHNVSCNEFMFFDRIDKHVGAEYRKNEYAQSVNAVLDADSTTGQDVKEVLQRAQQSTMPEYPQFIVVSTGDDYRNVQLANAIVQDIVNESSSKDEGSRGDNHSPTDHFNIQYIIVNVWDKRNARLLVKGNGTWNAAHDVLIAKDYVLLVVGNNDQIYTTGTMHADSVAIDYNHTYAAFRGLFQEENGQPANAGLARYIKAACRQKPQVKESNTVAIKTAIDDQVQCDNVRNGIDRMGTCDHAAIPLQHADIKDVWYRYAELKMLYYALQLNRQKDGAAATEARENEPNKTADKKGASVTAQDNKFAGKVRIEAAKQRFGNKAQNDVIKQVQEQIQSLDLEQAQKNVIGVACSDLLTLFGKDDPCLLYAKLDLWGRESTVDATMYAPVLRSYYKTVMGGDSQKELDGIARLCHVEHERWQRKHWVNGWVYKKETQKPLRQHKCLCPIENIDEDAIIGDLVNVLWAISPLFVEKALPRCRRHDRRLAVKIGDNLGANESKSIGGRQ